MSTNAELIARAKRAADAFYMPFTQRDLILELIAALEAAEQARKDAVRKNKERCCAILTRMKKFSDDSLSDYHDARAFERTYDAIRALPDEE